MPRFAHQKPRAVLQEKNFFFVYPIWLVSLVSLANSCKHIAGIMCTERSNIIHKSTFLSSTICMYTPCNTKYLIFLHLFTLYCRDIPDEKVSLSTDSQQDQFCRSTTCRCLAVLICAVFAVAVYLLYKKYLYEPPAVEGLPEEWHPQLMSAPDVHVRALAAIQPNINEWRCGDRSGRKRMIRQLVSRRAVLYLQEAPLFT